MKLDPKLIDPNPYQPRGDLGDLSELAASIKAHGLMQRPSVRAVGKRYQLQFGHRRHAAWQIANPGQPIEVEVVEATDQQMFEAAVVENEHRASINPIERAHAMKRYIDEFHVSQAEAGVLFGLATQGAVSNALRLLKLPAEVLKHIETGDLPERVARQLVVIAEVFPKDAAKIAEKVANAQPEDKQWFLDDGIEMLMRSKGRQFHRALFATDWPKEEIPVKHKSLSTIGSCIGCPFFINRKNQKFCGRPDCFDLKTFIYIRTSHVPPTAEALGLKAGAEGEIGQIIFQGEEKEQELAKAALATKHESLRIVPNPRFNDNDYWRSHILVNILGNANVALGTTDLKALMKAIEANKSAKPVKSEAVKQAEAQKKFKAKEAEQKARRDEIERLTQEGAKYFAKVLPNNAGLLELMAEASMSGSDVKLTAKENAAQFLIDKYFDEGGMDVNIESDMYEANGQEELELDFNKPENFKVGLAFLAKRLGLEPVHSWTWDLHKRDSRISDALYGKKKKAKPAPVMPKVLKQLKANAKPKGKKK